MQLYLLILTVPSLICACGGLMSVLKDSRRAHFVRFLPHHFSTMHPSRTVCAAWHQAHPLVSRGVELRLRLLELRKGPLYIEWIVGELYPQYAEPGLMIGLQYRAETIADIRRCFSRTN